MKKKLNRWDYEHNPKIKIPANIGVGLKWHDDEDGVIETKLDGQLRNGKRIAYLKQSTYVGTCAIGAIHYYGRIDARRAGAIRLRDGALCGGYMGKNAPGSDVYFNIDLQIERRISKVEKDWAGDVVGKIGEMTYRHNKPDHIVALGIKLFKQKFGPGWVLLSDEDCTVVLCET